MRCLIIDDDGSARGLMEQLIARVGHRARGVPGFREALGALKEEGFDVAIVDMEMSDATGPTAIGALRRLAPTLRVLVVSGHGDRRHVLAAVDAGADGYLLKDEIGVALVSALQELRAGHSPLSPRVAGIVIRQLRFRRLTEAQPAG
jgi:DNA-binding NarL/FixJ family response regulator